MALNYKLCQSKRDDKTKGKWYARACYNGTVTIDDLADIMQSNCTVKRSDILAVISELVDVMNDQLKNSKVVKLDRFGSFKLGMTTTGEDKVSDWSVSRNVKDLHVIFIPERKKDSSNRTYTRAFLSGVKLQEQNFYDIDSSADADDQTDTDGE